MSMGGVSTTSMFSEAVNVTAGLKKVHRRNAPCDDDTQNIPNFIGCDGEGGNVDGLSAYYLLRVGTSVLYPGEGRRIGSLEAFNFLWQCAQDMSGTFVGFFFDYDISNILRDLPWDVLRKLADRESRTKRIIRKNGEVKEVVQGVYWRGFRFDHIPRKSFTLERIGPDQKRIGKTFHLHDVFGFFACSFLKAIQKWGVGETHWEMIQRNKEQRINMTGVYSAEEIEYNRLECVLLEQLMTEVARACAHVGIKPSYWTGAGALAQALLKKYKAPVRVELPVEVRDAAQAAFHAGRFECSVTGPIDRVVHEYDLASAYSWAIMQLPCLGVRVKGEWQDHGKWIQRDDLPESGYFVARLRWEFNNKWRAYSQNRRSAYGPFPVRRDNGSIHYPRNGEGWYWSPEIRAALKITTGQRAVTHPYDIHILDVWEWVPSCTCSNPFGWVAKIYEERKRIGKGGRGLVLKLALNSLYGKFAQSVGKAPYGNPVYAGIITSLVRARMLDVIATGADVVMIATDGIYTLDEVKMEGVVENDGTAELGQWEHLAIPDMFIAKPGHYWSTSQKVRTRGISYGSFVPFIDGYRRVGPGDASCLCGKPARIPHTHVPRYEDVFLREGWEARVSVTYNTFIGYRLALQRNDPGIFCQWIEGETHSSSRTTIRGKSPKRAWFQEREGRAYRTEPLSGLPIVPSQPYKKLIGNPFEVNELYEAPEYGRGFGDDDSMSTMLEHTEG